MTGLMYIALHLVGDFILQSDWMAQNKRNNRFALIAHCTAYTAPFALMWLLTRDEHAKRNTALLWASHAILDSREWGAGSKWEHRPFFVDQALHIIVLAAIERKDDGSRKFQKGV